MTQQPTILIVTGYSGAGKTTVLRALEDIGFLCIDNLPLALLDTFYQYNVHANTQQQPVALGIDVRSGLTIESLMQALRNGTLVYGHRITIFFLTASSRVLLRRFQETRRKHPLAETIEISQAIEQEQELMFPLSQLADIIVDTDQLTIHQLRNFVRNSFAPGATQKMMINLVSFGFKYGVPLESNFVYDLRSLPNPYFIPALKVLKGTDPQVMDYLFTNQEVLEYWNKFLDFVRYSIEKSHQEGRFFIKIAVGCTGGRHRSVAFVHKLAEHLSESNQIIIEHRDITHDTYQFEQLQKKE